jgi:lysophospholipase L1-like esterase
MVMSCRIYQKDFSMKRGMTIVGFGDSITEAACGMPDASKRWLSVLKVKLMAAFPSGADCESVLSSGP